jgi:FMN phosphatase YigB (HAD superfamily)
VLAVAFALDDTLAAATESVDPVALRFAEEAGPDVARAVEAQRIAPRPGALRVVRELEALAVPLAILASGPADVARRTAELLWFAGPVVVGEHPSGVPAPSAFAALCAHFALPAECVWYITGRSEADARGACAAGLRGVFIDPAAVDAPEPDARGLRRIAAIGDVLDLLRGPYTRSALNMRYLMRTVLDWS